MDEIRQTPDPYRHEVLHRIAARLSDLPDHGTGSRCASASELMLAEALGYGNDHNAALELRREARSLLNYVQELERETGRRTE